MVLVYQFTSYIKMGCSYGQCQGPLAGTALVYEMTDILLFGESESTLRHNINYCWIYSRLQHSMSDWAPKPFLF
jgi:hypothetical protein